MITQNGYDYDFKTALYSVGSVEEIAQLPTTTADSVVDGKTYKACAAGSYAYLTDGSGKKYVLDGDSDSWKEDA